MELIFDLDRYAERLRIRRQGKRRQVFDRIRSKWVALEPEELVRQIFVHFLLDELGYNPNRFVVERGVAVIEQTRRCDILVLNAALEPWLLVECKAFGLELSQRTFRQVSEYSLTHRADFLAITNGRQVFCSAVDYENGVTKAIGSLPAAHETVRDYL
jgi:hypothetical protein